jgi:hypothetical protein
MTTAIDSDADPRSRLAPSVDHIRPLVALDLQGAAGRRAAIDPDNLRGAHVCCNASRREGRRQSKPERADWW